jgi:hypothetical protein
MDTLIGFLLTLGLITMGLVLIAARWKSWRPVLKLWLQVLKIGAIMSLYVVYYAFRGVALLLKTFVKGRSGRGGKDVLSNSREQWRTPR